MMLYLDSLGNRLLNHWKRNFSEFCLDVANSNKACCVLSIFCFVLRPTIFFCLIYFLPFILLFYVVFLMYFSYDRVREMHVMVLIGLLSPDTR
jgi:hypothetical protein